MANLKQRAIDIYNWFERRLGLGRPAFEAAAHEVPSSTSSWWYVFGSAATVILILQVVTGILLALVYVPSAGHAWSSLEFLDHNVRLGWYLRALHGWGSDFMVAIVLIHLVQVFLFGAYKFPRELTWIVGVFLLLLTLGMAFTGQVLRFDQDAYWGLGIGASILSRVPWVGGATGGFDAGRSHHRGANALALLHPACLRHSRHSAGAGRPALLNGAAARHQRMADAGTAGEQEDLCAGVPQAHREDRHSLRARRGMEGRRLRRGHRACHHGLRVLVRARSAPQVSPIQPSSQTAPKPDFAFLWIYAVLAYLPPSLETPVMFIAPIRRHLRDAAAASRSSARARSTGRAGQSAVLMVALIAVTLGAFTRLGDVYAVEPGDECMEQRSNSAGRPEGSHSARTRGSDRAAEQAMPQLPLDRWSRRNARACSGLDRIAHDRRPDHPPGPARRREHACVWKRTEPARDNCAGAFPAHAARRQTSRRPSMLRERWLSASEQAPTQKSTSRAVP